MQERLSKLRVAWYAEAGWTGQDRREWSNLALHISMAKIESQRNEVIRIRTQSLLFVTFMGAALAFLVGTVINPQIDRTPMFYVLASIGTALLGLLAIILVLIIAPFVKFNFSVNAKTLLGWMGGPDPAADYLEAVKSLVDSTLPKDAMHNRSRLVMLRWLFAALLITGLLALAMWIWALWACT